MFCKNCGNELKNGEDFCNNCGYSNEDKKPKGQRNIKLIYIIIIVIIGSIITGMIISTTTSQNGLMQKAKNASDTYNNDVSSQQNTNAKSNQASKEYYDFIDKDYKTFNFTENELVNRYMQGKSYTSQGFERIKGTEVNTFLYTKVNIEGVQFLSITNSSTNNKVSKIELGLVVTGLNQNQLEQYSYNMFNNLMGTAIYPDKNNSNEIQKYQAILQEVLNGKSMDKGLKYTGNIDKKNNVDSITVKLEVI